MYQAEDGRRVIVFSGLLLGMMAAYEGTESWDKAFELSERLNEKITALFSYKGSLDQKPRRSVEEKVCIMYALRVLLPLMQFRRI